MSTEDEVVSGLGSLETRVANLESGVRDIKHTLDRNTADTSELLGMFRDAKGGFRVLTLMGSVLKWIVAVGAAAAAMWVSLKGGK